MMDVLIVTGGIGSGKSSVCRILREKGASAVYEADLRAKMLYGSVPGLLSDVERALNGNFRNEEGGFDPSKLSSVVFADECKLTLLEDLIYPALVRDFAHFASDFEHRSDSGEEWICAYSEEPFIVFESATVLEKPFFDGFGDKVVLVDAPLEVRMARASRRDGVSRESILSRMKRQPVMNAFSDGSIYDWPRGTRYADIAGRVDAVIDNSSSESVLEAEVDRVMRMVFNKVGRV